MIETNSKLFLNKICEYFSIIAASMAKSFSQNDNSSFKIHN